MSDRQSSDQEIELSLPSTQAQSYSSNVSYLANQSYWNIFDENDSINLNKTITNTSIPPTQQWFFYSETLDTAYIIWRTESYWGLNHANVTTFSLENATTTNQSIYWNEISEQIKGVYDTEQLIYVTASCCLCITGYYYRYSNTKGLEYLTTLDNWDRRLVDTRVQRLLIMNSMYNQVEIITYNKSMPIMREKLNWSRSYLESRFIVTSSLINLTTNFVTSSQFLAFYMIMASVIFYRRKRN